jgi:hypothetical protein
MTPKKLLFVTLSVAGSMTACKDKPATNAAEPANDGAVQVLSQPVSSITGSWTGLFEPDVETVSVDKFGDTVTAAPNKITLFISHLKGGNIKGYSVCAGNQRPFSGGYEEENGKIKAVLQEPGDNKYDGVFELEISKENRTLAGKWTPFNKELAGRHYNLDRKNFNYVAAIGSYPEASSRLLKPDDVNNLIKNELRYMRNEIYARHGYSFKLKDVRQYFDKQDWYMPVSTDVRTKLSAIEVKNEKMIKNFEKYAEESYDDFGR